MKVHLLSLPLLLTLLTSSSNALDDGLCLTPPLGFNSWTAFGSAVTANDLIGIGKYLVSSGLWDAGYRRVGTDDGWSTGHRDANGRLQADPVKFPGGIPALVASLAAMNITFSIYTAESSVVCSGRPGTLYNEVIDAETFVEWGVTLVKNDNCGEYTLGNTRYQVFADAVAAAGGKMIISTEPFNLVPTPEHATWAHYWRTGNDIDAQWSTILDRIDRNDKWQPFAGPGHFNDPDMLQIGNGDLTLEEQRSHFGLWAITKSPLLLASDIRRLSQQQLAILSNRAIIGVNQDPLGIQARKLAVNGTLTSKFVGLAPCSLALGRGASYPDGMPGPNGVTSATLTWSAQAAGPVLNGSAQSYRIFHNATRRCLATRNYMDRVIPALVPCDLSNTDTTQLWVFPTGTRRLGGVLSVFALQEAAAGRNPSNATALSVSQSTLYGTVHGSDTMALPDMNYGIMSLGLAPYAPEPPCGDRNCQNYDPTQTWYWSPTTNTIALAHAPANAYRCYEGPCYQLTSHLPTYDQFCLSSVASISNDGVDPTTTTTGGVDVWGGPLSGGACVFGLLNRNPIGSGNTTITAEFSFLETDGMDGSTTGCARELFSNTLIGPVKGSVSFSVAPHDTAIVKVVVGAQEC